MKTSQVVNNYKLVWHGLINSISYAELSRHPVGPQNKLMLHVSPGGVIAILVPRGTFSIRTTSKPDFRMEVVAVPSRLGVNLPPDPQQGSKPIGPSNPHQGSSNLPSLPRSREIIDT